MLGAWLFPGCLCLTSHCHEASRLLSHIPLLWHSASLYFQKEWVNWPWTGVLKKGSKMLFFFPQLTFFWAIQSQCQTQTDSLVLTSGWQAMMSYFRLYIVFVLYVYVFSRLMVDKLMVSGDLYFPFFLWRQCHSRQNY